MKRNLLFILLFIVQCLSAQNTINSLKASWQFRQSGTQKWFPAKVPGTVHTDLLANKQIKDPFLDSNEKQVQWVSETTWEYEGVFTVDSVLLKRQVIELRFHGLDTYASIYLNDSLLLIANNMFRSWTVSVKRLLKTGKNTLKCVFVPATKVARTDSATLSYALPEGLRVFSRKAQYHYGWDFAPRLLTCGIWKPVELIAFNEIRLESLGYEIKKLDTKQAGISFIYRLNCESEDDYELQCRSEDDKKVATKKVHLKQGFVSDTFNVMINEPKLWWCNGYGPQKLYRFTCSVVNKKINQSIRINVGLRKIELIQQKDSIGTSFYFKLNEVPVFMKGANYVPQDVFLPGVNADKINQLIELAKNANMNMLRVWGGGTYPGDEFYDACDKAGILVWQDFMFACAMYPGNKLFIDNVNEEARQQVLRLGHHPSLALWCGNNEIDEGWKNWGWQKQFAYSKADSATIYSDYQLLFNSKLPQIIKELSPAVPYWSTSPSIGWGHKESLRSGDSHYWGVWWGLEPFCTYQKKISRFASEYGFQGMSDWSSLTRISSQTELNLNSESLRAHQKHPRGFETITTYMARDYRVPDNLRQYSYVSQLLQRDGMKLAMEAHRSNKPYCMGSLFWQLNDCWPAISWSAIDYYHTPKATYFTSKKSFAKFLVCCQTTTDGLNLVVVSDSVNDFNAKVELELMSFTGQRIWQRSLNVKLSNSSATKILVSKHDMPDFDTTTCFLKMEVKGGNKSLALNNHYFTSPKNLKLPPVNLKISGNATSGYTINSNVLAKDVYLYTELGAVVFMENYFDILPGVEQRLYFKGKQPQSTKEIKYMVLNNL